MPWNDQIKRRLKLRDLDILMAVVETGSMGKAAERLGRFQPAVSKAIADLEHTLGVRLLDRMPHGTVPTPYALHWYAQHRSIQRTQAGRARNRDLADPDHRRVAHRGKRTIVAGLFPALFYRLSRRYPRLCFM